VKFVYYQHEMSRSAPTPHSEKGLLRWLPSAMLLILPLSLFGADQPTEQSPEAEMLETIEAPRNYLSAKIISYAQDLDRFFGDDRYYQEANKSVVQLGLSRASGYGGDRKLVVSTRANLNLPSTEQRLHLLLESDPDQNVTGEPTLTQNTPQALNIASPQSYGLALRYEKVKEALKPVHLSTDGGLKFQGIHTNPFVRARASYSVPLDEWRLKAEQSIYWFNTIGLGETTQIDVERVFSERLLFRATSNATWLKDRQNFDLRQDFSFYHTVNDRTALLYQASVIGVSNPQWEVTDYVATVYYRYRLHKAWMFFEFDPQLHFPKANNFNSSFALNARLEILFNDAR
jgi:hypothetical protein